MVFRTFVEKKPGFDVEARQLAHELRHTLGVDGLERLRLVNRYDVEGVSKEVFERSVRDVFSEPACDVATPGMPEVDEGATVFAVEYLPGQFDQRADSASECVQVLSGGERPKVASATVYVLEGKLSETDVTAVKRYLINPVEAREASLGPRGSMGEEQPEPGEVEVLEGFRELSRRALRRLVAERGLAMSAADAAFCQEYFRREGRDPTITEIRVVDTYWSDHCRHTTFGTELDEIAVDDVAVRAALGRYRELRRELGEEGPETLMDMATIGARWLRRQGRLEGLVESEEVNACTVRARVDVDGHDEDWLVLFKNETHNHPTEIEPFGGAATCIGGAIRDPLSGRAYVYQAMRVTGAGDPTAPVAETLAGKLPQRSIVRKAAEGYSSYGNQVGLATGQVSEVYHPGYVAKRLEIGAVVGAVPEAQVRRERPEAGDVVVLVGGRTGRDGIGGATGSSKAHGRESLATCGAEVQKGNAPTERKLQRLFRRADACRLVKRCNDFGAGGVAVAIGELAAGLDIDLDQVPKKYEGLDGTELAISESQERMAVALEADDVERFVALAGEENLEATPVATVTAEPRLRMRWRGDVIVDLSREFLASNGAPRHQRARVGEQGAWAPRWEGRRFAERMRSLVSDLNVASNKGLAERFDSTIGAGAALMPFGGATQLTPAAAMVAKLPVSGETRSCTGMAWGFNPQLSAANQYQGAYLAVVESLARLVAAGFEHGRAYLTFQEYFERLRAEPARWGRPVAALLGALDAQLDLGVAAVGGKDSMSGSFERLDVPPTLVSFAVAVGEVGRVCSPELKAAGHALVAVVPRYRADGMLTEPEALRAAFELVEGLVARGEAAGVSAVGRGGAAEALFKACVGNRLGVRVEGAFGADALLAPAYGSFVVELADGAEAPEAPEGVTVAPLGTVTEDYALAACGEVLDLGELQEAWEAALEGVYPYRGGGAEVATANFRRAGHPDAPRRAPAVRLARPKVVIPVFPGTNCEFDTLRAFERAGAEASALVINNLTPGKVEESTKALAAAVRESNIVMLPGGFSAGDEPDGSAKLICAFFRAPEVAEAVGELLDERGGLMLGICNGFQALIKLGLVPYGEIRDLEAGDPTLTFNSIGRHQSRLVRTRVASDLSPWLSRCRVGEIHTVPVSHGEGRLVADEERLRELAAAGQVACQYVDADGVPSMDLAVNPNGSAMAIEALTSPDGRVLGKMAHSERRGEGLYRNVAGNSFQPLFEGGVAYFA